MSRWFRHYAGMMRDEKFVRIALKTGQSVERVVWIWGAILESAAEINADGKYEVDTAEIAYFLRAKAADVCNIIEALKELGRLHDNSVVKWRHRQFVGDGSAERQRRYRDKRKALGDVPEHVTSDVTQASLSRNGDAPELETETELEKDTAQHAISEFEKEARAAAGDSAPPDASDFSPIVELVDKGYDFVKHILPVIRARKGKPVASWRYFVAAIEQSRAANAAIKPNGTGTPAEPVTWLPADSPMWGALNRRSQLEKKRPLIARGSVGANGVGAFVPSAWLVQPDLTGTVN